MNSSAAVAFTICVTSLSSRVAIGQTSDPSLNRAAQIRHLPPPESKAGWRQLTYLTEIRRVGAMNPAKLDALKEWLSKTDDRNFAADIIRHGYIVLEVERNNSAKT